MANTNPLEPITILSGEALEPNRIVKLSTGTLVYADAGEASSAVGITLDRKQITQPTGIKPITAGVYQCVAAEAFSQGAVLYCGNDGTVQDTSSGTAIGRALQAAGAANDIVDCYLVPVTPA